MRGSARGSKRVAWLGYFCAMCRGSNYDPLSRACLCHAFYFWRTLGLLTYATGRFSIETLLISVCGLMKRGIWIFFWPVMVVWWGTTHLVIFMNQADASVYTPVTQELEYWYWNMIGMIITDMKKIPTHDHVKHLRAFWWSCVFKNYKSAYEDVVLSGFLPRKDFFSLEVVCGCMFRGNGQLWVFLLAVLYVGRFQVRLNCSRGLSGISNVWLTYFRRTEFVIAQLVVIHWVCVEAYLNLDIILNFTLYLHEMYGGFSLLTYMHK